MSAKMFNAEMVLQWLQNGAETFDLHKDELTELDAAIGDADHGANMARGFTAVKGKLGELKGKDIGVIFKTVAMTLISTVGGASGPLYGTFFLQAANGANGKSELALAPALNALKPAANDTLADVLDRAVAAARKGSDSTVPLVASKGRASYLGERSAGHRDPGAASSVLLIEALQKAAAGT
jgi:dihydroxyacetone kinase-like protein